MKTISIVVPVYKCPDALKELLRRVVESIDAQGIAFEVIFVYDGGPREDLEAIERLCEQDKRVIGIELSRNFGQHNAITAGLENASGEWIVVMDCDLQDSPEDIIKLYDKAIDSKADIVFARRTFRYDSITKRLVSKVFYRMLEFLTDTSQDATIGNFGIYHRNVIAALLRMNDRIRYLPTQIRWVGFKTDSIDVVHEERKDGKTSYSYSKLMKLALDVMLAFSDKPLRMIVKLGIFISFLSVVFTIITLVRYFSGSIHQLGYTSLIISIWFLFGLLIFIVGFVGLYVGKIFEQVKGRPNYIIKRIIRNAENTK